jgi:hypothetical protein
MDSLCKSGLSIRHVCTPLFSPPRRSKQTMTRRMDWTDDKMDEVPCAKDWSNDKAAK